MIFFFNTGLQGHRPEGNVNLGGSPCRKRSQCLGYSCQPCAGVVEGGKGRTRGGPSSTLTERGRTVE